MSRYSVVGYPIYDCPTCQGSDISEPRIFFFDSLDEVEEIIYGKKGQFNKMQELKVLYEDEKLIGKFEYKMSFHKIHVVNLFGLDHWDDADGDSLIRKWER